MSQPTNYQLLDFGDGRKLEQFGPVIVDRPCPAAEDMRCDDHAAWKRAGATFKRRDAQSGRWRIPASLPEPWVSKIGEVEMTLAPTPAGQVGLFPEQADNWLWLDRTIRSFTAPQQADSIGRPRVLNLFGYTGASTLAAARAGAEVVHVDSAKSSVQWARRNATINGLSSHPIRWIVEDAPKFVRRELKRGSRYCGIILDPPTYGHGPKREAWDIRRDLTELWQNCLALLDGRDTFILLSSHSLGFDRSGLQRFMDAHHGPSWSSQADIVEMNLISSSGRSLPSGTALRWSRHDVS